MKRYVVLYSNNVGSWNSRQYCNVYVKDEGENVFMCMWISYSESFVGSRDEQMCVLEIVILLDIQQHIGLKKLIMS